MADAGGHGPVSGEAVGEGAGTGPTGPADPQPAPDQAARDRIATDLSTTLFVEAGAGSGKTTALVERVVALVVSGTVELRSIAAVTFTEKAGAELRDRLRRELEDRATGGRDAEASDRCLTALGQLDGAAIGTLHAFARRLLSEHPVEAGLPPAVEVLDEVSSGVEFEARWATFRDELLDDPSIERTLLLFLSTGVGFDALRVLAMAFDDNWDLVTERVPAVAAEPPSVHELLVGAMTVIDEVCRARRSCRDPSDKLVEFIDRIASYAASLRAIDGELDVMEALLAEGPSGPPSFMPSRAGRQANWPGTDLAQLRDRVRACGEALSSLQGAVAEACARRLASVVRAFTLQAAQERRAAGRLEFHDLLVLTRSLLRDPLNGATVRARAHQRYQRLLLDEFQDTDPIQIELAVRIAALDPCAGAAGHEPWPSVPVAPGRLFVVGDPKQSIYRFRRADISIFIDARRQFGREGHLVELSSNFRTGEPVIRWVNATFATLMSPASELDGGAGDEAGDARRTVPPSQPAYEGLQAVRPRSPVGPPVAVVGNDVHPSSAAADDLRCAEADDVAGAVLRVTGERWSVDDGRGGWRAARLGDIAILLPARTSLPFLEDALERAGVAFRAESSSLVYASRAVRDLLMVLRAVDDPSDHLRIVAALRTPLLGCGDDDLFRFMHERKGSWSYLATQADPVPPDDPVRRGLVYLRECHDDRHWRAPAELLDRIARDRRAFELGFAEGRPRDVWRRLRFVIDQARAWSEVTGGSLRQYLHWVDQQTAEGARVPEAVLPETDDDAVRVMTIHAAKGLEFPVTIVSGMSTAPGCRKAPAQVVFPPEGEPGYRFGSKVSTPEFEAWRPVDEQMGSDERVRLLYVACTRARDHLIVSVHRKQRAQPPAMISRTNAELLVVGMGDLLEGLPDAARGPVGDGGRLVTGPAPQPAWGAGAEPGAVEPPTPVPGRGHLSAPGRGALGQTVLAAPVAFDEWEGERSAALDRARRPTTVAATALTVEGSPDSGEEISVVNDEAGMAAAEDGSSDAAREADAGMHKRPRDLDLPPWLKGRYGTSVGRAVHGVLQTIDLATGEGLSEAVAAQCQAEAVLDQTAEVRRLVEHALGSPSVREAAGSAHWREVLACTPVEGGRMLEGYVDLLYRGRDGLVIIDHKTAATSSAAELDRRAAGYRTQGASYALAVAAATGEAVVRVTFVFLTPDGAVERDLPDLDEAVADARALVTADAR